MKPCKISEWTNSTQTIFGHLMCPDVTGIDQKDLGIKGEFGDEEFSYIKLTFN